MKICILDQVGDPNCERKERTMWNAIRFLDVNMLIQLCSRHSRKHAVIVNIAHIRKYSNKAWDWCFLASIRPSTLSFQIVRNFPLLCAPVESLDSKTKSASPYPYRLSTSQRSNWLDPFAVNSSN